MLLVERGYAPSREKARAIIMAGNVFINGEREDKAGKGCADKKSLLYDKKGEEHYNLISALHKSMRNSDPDAAVYWLCRMLDGGGGPSVHCKKAGSFRQ